MVIDLTVPTSMPRYFTISPAVSPLTESGKRMRSVTSSRRPVLPSHTATIAAATVKMMMNSPSKK